MFIRPWFWIVFLSLIFISAALYFFVFYPGVQVKNIIIFGNQKVASKDIESLIFNNIDNKILSIGSRQINSKSVFLINSDKLDREILNKFPIIERVKIHKKFMQTLVFEINERVPVAVFCTSLDGTKGECYSMDKNGIIFETLDVMPQNMIIVRQSVNSAQIFIGKKVVQQNIIDLISKVEKDLKDTFQISLKEAIVTSPLRLDVNTNENWQIYFDLSSDSDINSQLTKLNYLLTNEIKPENRKNLRYINLIPDSKAIICDNKTCGG
jgi:cell division septal protein FtsQ